MYLVFINGLQNLVLTECPTIVAQNPAYVKFFTISNKEGYVKLDNSHQTCFVNHLAKNFTLSKNPTTESLYKMNDYHSCFGSDLVV